MTTGFEAWMLNRFGKITRSNLGANVVKMTLGGFWGMQLSDHNGPTVRVSCRQQRERERERNEATYPGIDTRR
jgi:hypothetical protein